MSHLKSDFKRFVFAAIISLLMIFIGFHFMPVFFAPEILINEDLENNQQPAEIPVEENFEDNKEAIEIFNEPNIQLLDIE
ncbi:MAG: hypothetical protein LRZ96_01650 [Candidatus Pacebacteria bacterium]|nr:hypothetical protein [Candidatus Paceibacterota bacterium]